MLTLCTHTEVHGFHHIDKGFILLVLDVRATPTRCTGDLCGDLGRFFLK